MWLPAHNCLGIVSLSEQGEVTLWKFRTYCIIQTDVRNEVFTCWHFGWFVHEILGSQKHFGFFRACTWRSSKNSGNMLPALGCNSMHFRTDSSTPARKEHTIKNCYFLHFREYEVVLSIELRTRRKTKCCEQVFLIPYIYEPHN